MKVKELIEYLDQNGDISSVFDAEDIIGGRAKKVANNLDPVKFRWFEVATDVYKCEDGYVGVTRPSQLYNEYDTWKDIDCPCSLSEFVAVSTITYIQKA